MRRVTETEGYSLVELLIVLAIAGLIGGAILGVYRVSQDTYIRASSLEAAQTGARAGLDRMANELRLIGSYWVGANCVVANCNAITDAQPGSITFRANVDSASVIGGAGGNEATATALTANTVTLSLSATATADAFKVYNNTALNDYVYIANGGTRDVRQITAINGNALTLASNLSSAYPVGSLVRDVKTITYTRNAGANALTRRQGGDNADTIVDNVTGLTFVYYGSNGGVLPPGNAEPPFCAAGLPNPDPSPIREIRIDLTARGADGSLRCMTTRVKLRSLP